jgi:hypothetical protein
MFAKSLDKKLLIVGGVLFVGGCAWAVLTQGSVARYARDVNPPTGGANYEPGEPLNVAATAAKAWPAPVEQAAGKDWKYHVFTPPVIYYNTESKNFTVEEPKIGPVEPKPENKIPFVVELAKVEQLAFRAQLGKVQGTQGVFTPTQGGPAITRSAGEFLPGLSIEVVKVQGQRVKKTDEKGNVYFEESGSATLRDLESGKEVVLKVGERLLEGEPSAHIRTGGAEERRVRVGEIVSIRDEAKAKDYNYKIDKLILTPESIVVTREASGDEPAETRTLAPTAFVAPALTPRDGAETGAPFGAGGPPPGFPFGPGGPPPGFFPGR